MNEQIEAFKPENVNKQMLNKATYLQGKIINWLNRQYLPLNIWIYIIEGILLELDKLYIINELQTSGNKEKAFQIIQVEQMRYLEKLKTEINLWELNNE